MVWCGASSRRPGCVEIALSALFHSLSALAGGVAGFPESEGICSCEAQERLDSPASGPDWGFWLAQLLSAFTAGALCLYLLERRAWERAATLPIVESIREEDGAWGSKASTCQEPQQLNTAADETVPTLGSSTLGAASASRGLSSAVSSDDQEVECLRLMRRCVGKVHGVMSEASSKSMDGIRLTGWLGKGSFSHVYRAQWGTADVALKVCKVSDKRKMERTLTMEAGIGYCARHPNVVTTYMYSLRKTRINMDDRRPLQPGDLEAEGAKQQECWEVRILQEVCDLGTLRTAIKEKHLCKDNSCHPHARGSLGSSSTKTLLSHKSSYTISQTASQSEASYTETPPPLDFWPEDTMPEMYEGTSGTTINTEMKQDMKAVLSISADVVEGMAYLHSKGIMHGDLKTSNILLKTVTVEGVQRVCAKIADFGTSVLMVRGQTEINNFFAGTPAFMAPEVLARQPVSKASDVYSFGILLYELSTGEKPYPNQTSKDIMYNVVHYKLRPRITVNLPRPLIAIITQCWHQEPSRRPTFEEIRDKFADLNVQTNLGKDTMFVAWGSASKPHRVKTSHDGLAAANSRRQLEEHHALGSYVACRGVLPRRARTAEAVLDQDTAASAEYGPMAKSEASGGSTAKLKFLHGSSVLGVTSREGRSISKELQQEHDSRRDKGDQLVRLLEPEAPNKGSGEGGESEASRLPESWAPRGTSQGCKGEASHSRRNISESFQWLSLAFARRNSSDCPDRGSIKTIKFLGKRWTVGGSRKSSQEELQVERPARSVSDHSSAGSKRAVSWNFMGGARTSLSSSTAALHPSINIPEEPTHSRKSAASKSLGNILSMATMDDKELRPRPLGYAGGTAQAYQGTPPEPGCSPAGATEMRSTPETSEAAALCARAAGLPSSPGSEGPTNSQWQTIPERYATTVEHPSPPEPSSKDDQKPDDLVRTSSTMSKTAALEGSTSCTLGSLRDVGANCQTHATPGSRRFSVAGHETVMNFFPSQQPTLHTILNNLVGGHKSGDKRKSPAPVPKPERVRVCSLDGCMADFPSPPFPDTTQMTYWGSPPSSTGVPFTPPRPASVEDLVELVETESMFAVAEESSSGGDEEVSEDSEESETLLFHQQQGHAVLLRK